LHSIAHKKGDFEMQKTLITTLLASAMIATPVSAQLLGGSGGVGGNVTGGLQGGIGDIGSTVERTTGSISSDSTLRGSTRTDKKVNTRKGKVSTNTDSSASSRNAVNSTANVLDTPISSEASGSASASGNVRADARVAGTDDAGNIVGSTVSTTRNAAGRAVGSAKGVANTAVDTASQAGSLSAGGNANGSGMAQSSLGQLVVSGAANGSGSFAVVPGMPIQGADGTVIGHVKSVKQTGTGVVETIMVETDNRTIPVPAASFAGSGGILVTSMTKGSLNDIPSG
jgi:hypothetical protein